MKTIQPLFLLAACIGLSACDQSVSVQNGQVPAEYLLSAKNIVGTYTGRIGGTANAFTISLSGDQASLSSSNDILASDCRAKLGELLSFTYNNDSGTPVIKSASFALDPGFCAGSILAREVDLNFDGTRNFSLNFLDRVEYQNHCYYRELALAAPIHGGDHDGDHDGDHGGGWHGNPLPPIEHCDTEAVNIYSYGYFSR